MFIKFAPLRTPSAYECCHQLALDSRCHSAVKQNSRRISLNMQSQQQHGPPAVQDPQWSSAALQLTPGCPGCGCSAGQSSPFPPPACCPKRCEPVAKPKTHHFDTDFRSETACLQHCTLCSSRCWSTSVCGLSMHDSFAEAAVLSCPSQKHLVELGLLPKP